MLSTREGKIKMKESVSGVFICGQLVYFIKRQNYLSVFPGYHSSPGGKVDKTDSEILSPALKKINFFSNQESPQLINALIREMKEELNFDIIQGIENKLVIAIEKMAVAITPEFNPYRFKNYYYKIVLSAPIQFELDKNEAEYGEWQTPQYFLDRYLKGKLLAVPPAIMLLEKLGEKKIEDFEFDLTLPYDPEKEVPMIESLSGIRQFLPLSHTFPPANRTNSFLIGDDGSPQILVDPSPKDVIELEKFLHSLSRYRVDKILITHHHPDHYEFAKEIARVFKASFLMSAYTFDKIGADYFSNFKVDFVSEGEVVTSWKKNNVMIYELPGHDEGQIGLAPAGLEWFLVGDLIQTIGTVLIKAPEGDMAKYFESLKRVINLNPANVIPSHGIILGGTNKLTETLKHRQMREDKIKELLVQGLSIAQMRKDIYPDLDEKLGPYAEKTIEAHIAKITSSR